MRAEKLKETFTHYEAIVARVDSTAFPRGPFTTRT